ncbi:hypothetical protein GCK72_005149 [Caenorhabditis remanei]|uniref:Homeobox domain-containing protein n=1 Tax=Caenorhabditis remanei TaxID=31234 RepID=A0A6A5HDI2_CAERE|nr:hypothetical protein GCK72_005149 [Caenorhabditis remanei]KAF1765197.1 hypothetical protein GCK72_005149 [Caenorhabditis remanei]
MRSSFRILAAIYLNTSSKALNTPQQRHHISQCSFDVGSAAAKLLLQTSEMNVNERKRGRPCKKTRQRPTYRSTSSERTPVKTRSQLDNRKHSTTKPTASTSTPSNLKMSKNKKASKTHYYVSEDSSSEGESPPRKKPATAASSSLSQTRQKKKIHPPQVDHESDGNDEAENDGKESSDSSSSDQDSDADPPYEAQGKSKVPQADVLVDEPINQVLAGENQGTSEEIPQEFPDLREIFDSFVKPPTRVCECQLPTDAKRSQHHERCPKRCPTHHPDIHSFLLKVLEKHPKPSPTLKKELVMRTGLTSAQIYRWFKHRKSAQEDHQVPRMNPSSSSIHSDYVASAVPGAQTNPNTRTNALPNARTPQHTPVLTSPSALPLDSFKPEHHQEDAEGDWDSPLVEQDYYAQLDRPEQTVAEYLRVQIPNTQSRMSRPQRRHLMMVSIPGGTTQQSFLNNYPRQFPSSQMDSQRAEMTVTQQRSHNSQPLLRAALGDVPRIGIQSIRLPTAGREYGSVLYGVGAERTGEDLAGNQQYLSASNQAQDFPSSSGASSQTRPPSESAVLMNANQYEPRSQRSYNSSITNLGFDSNQSSSFSGRIGRNESTSQLKSSTCTPEISTSRSKESDSDVEIIGPRLSIKKEIDMVEEYKNDPDFGFDEPEWVRVRAELASEPKRQTKLPQNLSLSIENWTKYAGSEEIRNEI